MTDDTLRKQLIADLSSEEETLAEAVKKAEVRLAQVRAARIALIALEADEPVVFDGKLADACRAALRAAGRALSPLEVREQIIAIGYDISTHKNAMASIHSVLKRLVDSKEAKALSSKDGTRYEWLSKPPALRTGGLGPPILGNLAGLSDVARALTNPTIPMTGTIADLARAIENSPMRQLADRMSLYKSLADPLKGLKE